jgi:hypothetical protein
MLRQWWKKHIVGEFPFPDQCWDCRKMDCEGCGVIYQRRKEQMTKNGNKRMELIGYINEMWQAFAEEVIAKSTEQRNVERFLEAKDRAHKVIAQMEDDL